MDNWKSPVKLMGIVLMIPFLLMIPPVVGWFAGTWLDEALHSAPLCRFVLIALGFAVGCREVYKIIKALSREP